MKLFSCKKTENQSHQNQSLISCGHCERSEIIKQFFFLQMVNSQNIALSENKSG